ncbi:MAG TPA: hypothetical protein VFU81_16135 [Thermomicrobiales bacterium]|nr:hypothetical protein [Thermomicrobiales bacterium]
MDETRFERLVRPLRSRRSALGALVGAGAAFGFGRPGWARPSTCQANGEPCDPSNASACCSGTCKKHNGAHVCAPAGQSLGCGKRKSLDFCRNGGNSKDCPHVPDQGGCCASSQTKRAICVLDLICVTCQSDAECVPLINDPAAQCISKCAACAPDSTTACILPQVLA